MGNDGQIAQHIDHKWNNALSELVEQSNQQRQTGKRKCKLEKKTIINLNIYI